MGASIQRLVLVSVVLLVGCARYSSTPVAVYGPYTDAATTWRQLEGATTARGYTPSTATPATGTATLPSRQLVWGQPTQFRVQLYSEGWVQITPQGAGVRGDDVGRVSMPSGTVEEYVALTTNLLPPPSVPQLSAGTPGFPSSPAQPPGALNPSRVGQNIDVPLIIAGAVTWAVGYVTGLVSAPLCQFCDEGYAYIPYASWLGAFLDGDGWFVMGYPAAALEIAGTIMILVGALRTTPFLQPGGPVQVAFGPTRDGGVASATVRF